mmetsp:Transcript_21700/g.71789  ORF Transcript_21700/g.71789 Transcript_21700/m.71789 type:complete len:195 (-) Transcript_21700:4-588(-)
MDTPVLQELFHTLQHVHEQDTILIDDARLFRGYRDCAGDFESECFPSLRDLKSVLCKYKPDWTFTVEDDLIRMSSAEVKEAVMKKSKKSKKDVKEQKKKKTKTKKQQEDEEEEEGEKELVEEKKTKAEAGKKGGGQGWSIPSKKSTVKKNPPAFSRPAEKKKAGGKEGKGKEGEEREKDAAPAAEAYRIKFGRS